MEENEQNRGDMTNEDTGMDIEGIRNTVDNQQFDGQDSDENGVIEVQNGTLGIDQNFSGIILSSFPSGEAEQVSEDLAEVESEEVLEQQQREQEVVAEQIFQEDEEYERDSDQALQEDAEYERGVPQVVEEEEREQEEDLDAQQYFESNPPQVELERTQQLEDVDYDIAVPSQHSYLEMPMQRVEGCNYWLEGQTVNLFMVPLDIIVIPGQTFPLRIRDSTLQFGMVRSLLEGNHNTFGAVHMPAEREQMYLGRSWSQFGVTVQIIEVSEDTPHEIVLKCKGRQRFKTIKTHRFSNTNVHATVSILADHIPARIHNPAGKLREPFASSGLPAWLYEIHDAYNLVRKIHKEISKVSRFVKLEVAPREPDMFSYWLISAMPFKFNQRVQMLRENNVVVRLMSQLSHLKKLNDYDYCCELCGIAIICSSHLLSMSTDGPFYVNPTGHSFELVTAYSIQNALSKGRPTERDSWFPGYAWSYLHCINCRSFLGWKFTSVDDSRQPSVFYGIQRNAVSVLEDDEELNPAENDVV